MSVKLCSCSVETIVGFRVRAPPDIAALNLQLRHGDVMFIVVTIGNDTELHIWKLLREYILKVLTTTKKFCNMVTNVN